MSDVYTRNSAPVIGNAFIDNSSSKLLHTQFKTNNNYVLIFQKNLYCLKLNLSLIYKYPLSNSYLRVKCVLKILHDQIKIGVELHISKENCISNVLKFMVNILCIKFTCVIELSLHNSYV
jgi:hypothetical protein